MQIQNQLLSHAIDNSIKIIRDLTQQAKLLSNLANQLNQIEYTKQEATSIFESIDKIIDNIELLIHEVSNVSKYKTILIHSFNN
jgi:archaellum component FlaC